MRKLSLYVSAVMIVMLAASCKKPQPEPEKLSPAQINKICEQAGQTAALAWVASSKPSKDQIKAVKVVLDQIVLNLKDYQQGGFISALPGIEEAIKKAIPGDTEDKVALRKMASNLAKDMLTGLDDVFNKHPDWKTKGAEVSGYVSVFCAAGSKALDDFAAAN
jgi:hypothetical protein